MFGGKVWLETTNFGQIAYSHSTVGYLDKFCHIIPKLPQILQNYEKWEYWGSGTQKCPIFVKLGVHIDDGGNR